MNKQRILSIALISFIFLNGCGQSNHTSDFVLENDTVITEAPAIVSESTVDASVNITDMSINMTEQTEFPITVPLNICEVIISPHNSKEMTFKYTDTQKINAIVEYISSFGILQKSKVSDPTKYYGSTSPMDYKISLYSEDGKVEDYYHFNNLYFKQGENGQWCNMEYVKAIAFQDIIQEYEPDIPAETPLFWDVTITVPQNVTEVIVAPYCSEAMTFKYTDSEKVNAIVAYISDFGTLKNTTVQDTSYCGMTYRITLCSADGDTEVYYHLGNLFFKQGEDGQWCDMKYDKASALTELLKEYKPDVPAELPLFPYD